MSHDTTADQPAIRYRNVLQVFGPTSGARLKEALVIDRISGAMAQDRDTHNGRVSLIILAGGALAALALTPILSAPGDIQPLVPVFGWIDAQLTVFTRHNGAALDTIKNTGMFYGLLPLRIGLNGAVLPFTWGFQWTAQMSAALFAVAGGIGAALAWRGNLAVDLIEVIAAGMIETGVTDLA